MNGTTWSSAKGAARILSSARLLRHPALLAALVFCVVAWATTSILPPFQQQAFMWSHNFSAAVSFACGRGFGEVESSVPSLTAFLLPSADKFNCSDLPKNLQLGELNAYASGIPYFLRGLGLYWRFAGVSWSGLAPLMVALYALSASLAFLLFRQFFGIIIALVLTTLYVASPVNFFSLTYYEHYAKTPFFLGIILALTWIVLNESSPHRFYIKALITGLLLGVGFGIRADLWLLMVPAIAAVLFFPKVRGGARWAQKGIAAAILAVSAGLAALSAATAGGQSYFWEQLLQGLSTPLNEELRVKPAIYEWVPLYSDNLAVSWMETHAFYQLDHNTPEAAENFLSERRDAPGALQWPKRERAGRDAYLSIMAHFPADFITRPLAATRALIEGSLSNQETYVGQIKAEGNFFARTQALWRKASKLSNEGKLLIVILAGGLLAMSLRNRSGALFFALLILFVGGASAIVFIPRHHWHLYIIGLFAVGALLRGAFIIARAGWSAFRARDHLLPMKLLRPHGASLVASGLWAVGLAALALVAVLTTHAVQRARVSQLVQQLLSAEAVPVALAREGTELGARYTLTDFAKRFWEQAFAVEHFEYGEYFRATFSHARCGEFVQVRLMHDSTSPFYDDSRTIPVEFTSHEQRHTLVFPAYFMQAGVQYGYLKALELSTSAQGCLVSVEKISHPERLPFLITWNIPEDWRGAAMRQTLDTR